jgi:glycosyltransferase involved in cell wall biosynthesis
MNILHTVESYSPSVGGAQEVVKQISERLVQRGHTVTVATSLHSDRHIKNINGVHIEEFDIRGNSVHGIKGEVERYQSFLRQGDFDIMMNYAAQQWATDSVYPVLDELQYKKILIPCGFSGLYWPDYMEYFQQLPDVLRRYDHLVFHANDYRDTNFARQHNIQNRSIIPNGASQSEFEAVNGTFRQRYGISEDEPLLLTVGSHTGVKGHFLAIKSLSLLKAERATLVIIGNVFGKGHWWRNFIHPLLISVRRKQFSLTAKILKDTLLGGIAPTGCLSNCRAHARWINLWSRRKRVILLDLPRVEVPAAFHAADLFVFGSNIEYSPIVLYEALASRTPFISLSCGNAAEIAAWSGGGIIAPTIQKDQGFVDGDATTFAGLVDELLADPFRRQMLAEAGYKSWLERFTWEKITLQYEDLYQRLISGN